MQRMCFLENIFYESWLNWWYYFFCCTFLLARISRANQQLHFLMEQSSTHFTRIVICWSGRFRECCLQEVKWQKNESWNGWDELVFVLKLPWFSFSPVVLVAVRPLTWKHVAKPSVCIHMMCLKIWSSISKCLKIFRVSSQSEHDSNLATAFQFLHSNNQSDYGS